MRSRRIRWRSLGAVAAVAALGGVGCEGDDNAIGPIDDIVPPVVSVTGINATATRITTTIRAQDAIGIAVVITEVTVPGLGFVADTSRTVGQQNIFTVITEFPVSFAGTTQFEVRGIAFDHAGNSDEAIAAGEYVAPAP